MGFFKCLLQLPLNQFKIYILFPRVKIIIQHHTQSFLQSIQRIEKVLELKNRSNWHNCHSPIFEKVKFKYLWTTSRLFFKKSTDDEISTKRTVCAGCEIMIHRVNIWNIFCMNQIFSYGSKFWDVHVHCTCMIWKKEINLKCIWK